MTHVAASTAIVSFGMRGVERGGVGELVVGTLLGPEGTGDCFFLKGLMLVVPPGVLCGVVAGVWRWGLWGDFPYVENCTVDASI